MVCVHQMPNWMAVECVIELLGGKLWHLKEATKVECLEERDFCDHEYKTLQARPSFHPTLTSIAIIANRPPLLPPPLADTRHILYHGFRYPLSTLCFHSASAFGIAFGRPSGFPSDTALTSSDACTGRTSFVAITTVACPILHNDTCRLVHPGTPRRRSIPTLIINEISYPYRSCSTSESLHYRLRAR